jgi:hypothetical protein
MFGKPEAYRTGSGKAGRKGFPYTSTKAMKKPATLTAMNNATSHANRIVDFNPVFNQLS